MQRSHHVRDVIDLGRGQVRTQPLHPGVIDNAFGIPKGIRIGAGIQASVDIGLVGH